MLHQLLCIALGKIDASVDFAIFIPWFRKRHLGGNYVHLEEVSFSNCSTHTSFAQKVSHVLGDDFRNQLSRMVWRRRIRQTKSLLMSWVRRFQIWMHYFSSLLGALIIAMN